MTDEMTLGLCSSALVKAWVCNEPVLRLCTGPAAGASNIEQRLVESSFQTSLATTLPRSRWSQVFSILILIQGVPVRRFRKGVHEYTYPS